MKIGLEIKNVSRAIRPKKDDVIIFDGKDWYVTSKKELFGEYEQKMDEKIKALNAMVKDNADFKKKVSDQMVLMSETIKKFVEIKGE